MEHGYAREHKYQFFLLYLTPKQQSALIPLDVIYEGKSKPDLVTIQGLSLFEAILS